MIKESSECVYWNLLVALGMVPVLRAARVFHDARISCNFCGLATSESTYLKQQRTLNLVINRVEYINRLRENKQIKECFLPLCQHSENKV
jgi:hypothetical protein